MFIEVKNLKKSFQKKTVVDGISFEIEEGSVFGLLGPNGAGKSTTISMLCGLLKPDAGEIKIGGVDLLHQTKKGKKLIGFVPQDIALYPAMTARENLFFWGRMYGLKGKELKSNVEQILKLFELHDRANEKIANYSGGMKRRINIAAAMIHKPRFLLMDEPTVGIDPQSRNNILELITKVSREGMTILYSSHYMEEIEQICSRMVVMDKGKILLSGTSEQIKDSASKYQVIQVGFKGDSEPVEDALSSYTEIEKFQVKDSTALLYFKKDAYYLEDCIAFFKSKDIPVVSINVQQTNLETAFLELTGKRLRD